MAEKIYVVPGAGVKVPLPIPGGGSVPAEGAELVLTSHVRRLLVSKDLVEAKPPEPGAPVTKTTARNAPAAEAVHVTGNVPSTTAAAPSAAAATVAKEK